MWLAARLITLAAVIGTGAWVFSEIWNEGPQWGSLTTFLVTLGGYLTLEASLSRTAGGNPNDIALFKELLELLPPTTIGEFLRNHDFCADFRPEEANALHQFAQYWGAPDHRFIDRMMESKRQKLYKNGFALASQIAQYTVPNRSGYISVVPNEIRGGPRPDWIRDQATQLNKTARAFSACYDSFVVDGRKRLHVAN